MRILIRKIVSVRKRDESQFSWSMLIQIYQILFAIRLTCERKQSWGPFFSGAHCVYLNLSARLTNDYSALANDLI